MICNKKLCTEVLNYFPSLLILVFSMAALSVTLRVMDEHRYATDIFAKASQNILELESGYNDYEDVFWEYYEGKPDVKAVTVRNKLKEFTELFYKISNGEYTDDAYVTSSFLPTFQKIEQFLVRSSMFIDDIEELRQDSTSRSRIAEEISELHEEIEEMWSALYEEDKLERLMNSTHQHEALLYWSVVAIGLSGFVLIVLNTDKLKRLKIADREREESLKLLEERLVAMEATFDGIGVVDKEGNISYMNRALIDMHGLSAEELKEYTGNNWRKLYSHVDSGLIENEVYPQLHLRGHWEGENTIPRKNGEVIRAEFSLTAMPEGGFIATVRDVSDKKKAEQERENLESQFYQAQKMEAVGRLAGGIAHDFNNILAAIVGYAEFLTDDLDKKTPQHKFAVNILKAGQQARSLIDQILAFSRIKTSEIKSMDLLNPAKETLNMISATFPRIIEVQSKLDIQSAIIQGNSTQISQVLMNLCVNAKDAMEEGQGVLSIELDEVEPLLYENLGILSSELPDTKKIPHARIEDLGAGHTRLSVNTMKSDQPYVRLKVSDTGEGMSRSIMEHVFEPFFTTKPVDKGTGLGLATVHGVVIAHQAAMIVTSRLGKGTTFEIFFPLSSKGDISEEIQIKGEGNIKGIRVLFVEDQEEIRQMMGTMLERLGAHAEFSVNGLEALNILRDKPGEFDLVITDQNMPKMTGLDFINRIHPEEPDLPFILLSGYSEEKLRQLMHEHPAIKDILRKPVSKDRLKESISSVMADETQGTA